MRDIDLKNAKDGFAPVIRLNSGYDLPVLGLGTYALHGNTCTNAVISAIQSGYRLIDTASFYGNEREVGEGVRKSDVTAYRAIEKAIQDGKVRTAGISCYYIRETDSFLPKVSIKPAVIQNEIHPYYQDSPVVEHIQNKGIVVQGWYPLGGRGYTGAMLNNPVLREIAATHGKSVAQVILRWNLQKGVCVIPGSGNPEHIRENISIFDFVLTDEEMESIATLNKNEKHDWY